MDYRFPNEITGLVIFESGCDDRNDKSDMQIF